MQSNGTKAQPAVSFSQRQADRLFVGIARAISPLPNFRGKVRAGLAMHRLLGLTNRHVRADVTLTRPRKYRMRFDLNCVMERLAALMGGYEPTVPEFLQSCYRGEGYILDVGANVGMIAIPLALSIRHKQPSVARTIWCIEPVKSNCESLRYNVALNGLQETITVLECCVGDAEGMVEINIAGDLRDGEGTGTANVLAAGSDYSCERIQMPVTTLDALVSSGKLPQDCSLIKIDCDGYDFNALRGAVGLLKSARPIVYGEFNRHCLKWHGQTPADVVDFMAGLEYVAFHQAGGDQLKFVPFDAGADVDQDLLFLPAEAVERFPRADLLP